MLECQAKKMQLTFKMTCSMYSTSVFLQILLSTRQIKELILRFCKFL